MKFSAAAFLAICAVGSAFVPSTPARAIRSKARTVNMHPISIPLAAEAG